MTKRIGLCVVGLWLMATSGFSQMPGEPPPLPPGPEDMLPPDFWNMSPNQIMTRANALLQQGDTNTAINMLMRCHEINLQQNACGFATLLNTLLATGDLLKAERLYQDNLAQRDHLTRNYINSLHQYYISQGHKKVLLDWTASLQTQALPPDLRAPAFGWLLDASRALGPVSRVMELVPVCVSNFDVPTSRGLLTGVITAYDAAGDQTSAGKVLDAIERATRRQSEWRLLVSGQRVNLLFSAARWKEAEARFQKEASVLPDGELAACFQYAQACASRASQFDLLDRLCAWVLKEQKNKPGTWQAAASAWLEKAKVSKAIADIPVRLEALMKMGCAEKALIAFYYEYWDVVVREGKPADLSALLKFGDRLSATLTNDKDKTQFKNFALDSYMILNDYEQALELLKKPFPGMKPPDQEIAINKIKAHLALQRGNKQEAVERFRAFMETVKTWTEPQMSPLTGLIHTKEMCLALNAKRIGDILASMNDARGARAAYQEAAGYYAVAQKEAEANSPESEYIKACQADLAKLLKNE